MLAMLCLTVLCGMANATVFNVNLLAYPGPEQTTIKGTLSTDGTTGMLQAADFTGVDLTVSLFDVFLGPQGTRISFTFDTPSDIQYVGQVAVDGNSLEVLGELYIQHGANTAYNAIDFGFPQFPVYPACALGPTCLGFDLAGGIGFGDGVNQDGAFVVPAVDVIGTAAVAEPGTIALLLAGSIVPALATRRRCARAPAHDADVAFR